MNSISQLIYEDKEVAESFIRKMANCYNYILDSYSDVLVKLKDELQFVYSYQYLLQTKYKNAIRIDSQLNEKDLEAKIPTLSLQLLIENAAKHNIINDEKPIVIKIKADAQSIIISNNKTEKPESIESNKIGLSNIISRYKLLGYENVKIQNDDSFTVILPKL